MTYDDLMRRISENYRARPLFPTDPTGPVLAVNGWGAAGHEPLRAWARWDRPGKYAFRVTRPDGATSYEHGQGKVGIFARLVTDWQSSSSGYCRGDAWDGWLRTWDAFVAFAESSDAIHKDQCAAWTAERNTLIHRMVTWRDKAEVRRWSRGRNLYGPEWAGAYVAAFTLEKTAQKQLKEERHGKEGIGSGHSGVVLVSDGETPQGRHGRGARKRHRVERP